MTENILSGGYGMHIEYFMIFNEVATAKSISKVAQNSHISQPALSQQLQRLEESLGFKLLERSNRGVELTEPGRVVDSYAKSIARAYNNMLEDLENIRRNNNTIRIHACPIVSVYALPCTIYKIQEQFPEYNFLLESDQSDAVEQGVANDVCQIGFVCGKPTDESLTSSKVGSDRIVPVAGKDYRIARKISLGDMLGHPLIMLSGKFKERVALDAYLAGRGHKVEERHVKLTLETTESVKSAVVNGFGVSFLPYISIKKELYTKQLIELGVPEFDFSYDIYIIYKKDRDLFYNTRELIQYIKRTGEKSFC